MVNQRRKPNPDFDGYYSTSKLAIDELTYGVFKNSFIMIGYVSGCVHLPQIIALDGHKVARNSGRRVFTTFNIAWCASL
jgi:hypothetical protein